MEQGLFWILAESETALEEGEFEIISYCNEHISHIEYWKEVVLKNKDLKLFAYDYFPRGRFWTNNQNIVILFANPILIRPKVINKLKELFDLNDTCQVHNDGVPPVRNFFKRSK